jgi:hypothetical protein
MHKTFVIDLDQIPDLDDTELTQEEKQQRLDDATAAMFAALFNSPVVAGGKAKDLIEARQAKAAGAALAALAALNG